jgi:hypothetical protein
MIKKVLKFLQYYGILSSFGLSLFLGYLYLVAYLNPTKIVIMDINHFGEAWWEVWVVSFMIVCACVAMWMQGTAWLAARRKKRAIT